MLPQRAAIWNMVSPCAMYDAAAVGLPSAGGTALLATQGTPPCTAGKPLTPMACRPAKKPSQSHMKSGMFGV